MPDDSGKKKPAAKAKLRATAKKSAPRATSAGKKGSAGLGVEISPPLRTFQSRRIIKTKWKGEEVEAVEGLFAYRREKGERVEAASIERAFSATVTASAELDRLGIGVISLAEGMGEGIRMARAETAAPSLGADVGWVEPVMLDHISLTPNDPSFPEQWGLKEIQAERAWDLWTGQPNRVVLAVLDSGIPLENGALSHADLNDPNLFLLSHDVVNNDEDPADDHGHGTHVIGIAAAIKSNSIGVAGLWPGLVLAVKIFDGAGNGSSMTFKEGVLRAVDFAEQRGAHLVINYSGGGPDSQVKKSAVEYARDKGALLVAAAGNGGANAIDYPAAYAGAFPNVIAVGAVDRQRNHADFSNRGDELTVVAPGVDILSTLPNYFVTLNSEGFPTKYGQLQGTSMATPFVSALAALVWSQQPGFSAEEVRDKITSSADPIQGSPRDFGHGMINAERALT